MGVEYKIGCDPETLADFDTFLRRAPFFNGFDEELRLYNLRLSGPDKLRDGPDAHVALHEDGLWFLDNLSSPNGEASRIFHTLVDHALQRSGSVTVTDP